MLAIGPEGGWADDELELFRQTGWASASLGCTILRAETAAIAATAITMSELGWLIDLRYIRRRKLVMNKGHIYFEIQADDTKRAIDFYSQVFGWKFSLVPGLPIPYWTIETGGSRGGLLQRPAKTPPPQSGTNAFVCSLEVENFDATAQTIQELGGIVALPKFAVPNTCWQGYFVDPEGNTFGIFQVDPNAGN